MWWEDASPAAALSTHTPLIAPRRSVSMHIGAAGPAPSRSLHKQAYSRAQPYKPPWNFYIQNLYHHSRVPSCSLVASRRRTHQALHLASPIPKSAHRHARAHTHTGQLDIGARGWLPTAAPDGPGKPVSVLSVCPSSRAVSVSTVAAAAGSKRPPSPALTAAPRAPTLAAAPSTLTTASPARARDSSHLRCHGTLAHRPSRCLRRARLRRERSSRR